MRAISYSDVQFFLAHLGQGADLTSAESIEIGLRLARVGLLCIGPPMLPDSEFEHLGVRPTPFGEDFISDVKAGTKVSELIRLLDCAVIDIMTIGARLQMGR